MEATRALIQEQRIAIRNIEESARKQWAGYVRGTFEDCLLPEDTVEQNYSYAEIRRDKADLFSMSFSYPGSISYYTSSDSSDWGLDRLITVGKVAELFKECRKEMCTLFSAMEKQIEKDTTPHYEILSALNKQLKEMEGKDKQDTTLLLLQKLKSEGIHFLEDERGMLPAQITLKFGKKVFNVLSIKALSLSASGSSCSVEIKYRVETWDMETDKFILSLIHI